MKTIKPALILTLFLTVASTLLIVASKQFVIDRTILNDDMKSLCVSLMGEGEYRVATDYAAEGFAITESDKPTYIVRV
ncbi:MAG: hypothetical protein LBN40_00080, partial [Oscillospiraceae bacterium]|nr:hypothetical protein [Oscillospiraceae bacterium]